VVILSVSSLVGSHQDHAVAVSHHDATPFTSEGLVHHLRGRDLVRPSFVPPQPIRELRNLTRYRKAHIQERTREAQRLDTILQDAGIKLSSVASDVLGRSGRAMLAAVVAGSRDPDALADLARGALRRKIPALRLALTGRFTFRSAPVGPAWMRAPDLLQAEQPMDSASVTDLFVEGSGVRHGFTWRGSVVGGSPAADDRRSLCNGGRTGVVGCGSRR